MNALEINASKWINIYKIIMNGKSNLEKNTSYIIVFYNTNYAIFLKNTHIYNEL